MREIERVKDRVQKGEIPPVYLWYGEDRFLIQEALNVLKSFYLEADPSGSGLETVAAKELPPSEIVNLANSISFFAQRLVVVEEAPYFQDGQSADLEPFLAYFANPNPAACLLFLAENVHKGRKFYKALAKYGEILEFGVPKRAQDWLDWLQSELKTRGKSMDPQAAAQFIEWTGHNAGILCRELDKLVIYTGDRPQITAADFESLTPRTMEAGVFDLLDAVARQLPAKALQNLREVLRQEHPLKVLTMLVRQVRLLLGCNALRKRGGNPAEAPAALKISPYEAKKVWQQSLKLSEEQLFAALEECLKTEIALKSGGGDPGFLLEMMIVRFCGEEGK